MKITMYTITSCQFSQQEREYLSTHALAFEEKNLETNREFLTEMLAVGSNFAGTPVTKIEKDDGQIVVLKGFTAAEFDKALGITVKSVESVKPVEIQQNQPEQVQQPVQAPMPPIETTVASPDQTQQVQQQQKPMEPAMEPPVQEAQPIMPQVETKPLPPPPQTAPTPVDPAMASVLDTLQQQAQVPPPPGAPVVPDPQF